MKVFSIYITIVLFIILSFFLLNPRVDQYYPGIDELISLTKTAYSSDQYKEWDEPLRFAKCNYFYKGSIGSHGATINKRIFFRNKHWNSIPWPLEKLTVSYQRGMRFIKEIKNGDTILEIAGPVNFEFTYLDFYSRENLVDYYDSEFSTCKELSDVRELPDYHPLQGALNPRTFILDSLIIQYGYTNENKFVLIIQPQRE